MSGLSEAEFIVLQGRMEGNRREVVPMRGRADQTPPTRALPPAKGTLPEPEMNKTEAAYDAYLALQERAGAVLWHKFECVTVKIAADCRLTPDFLVMLPDGRLEFHDTKGAKKIKIGKRAGQRTAYFEEDALIKAKVAAALFPIPIYFVWPEPNGEWGKKRIGVEGTPRP
jgi:hypothetical protein